MGRKGYSAEQIEQLYVIRELLNSGFLPGQVVGRPLDELHKLKVVSGRNVDSKTTSSFSHEAIKLLKSNDLQSLVKLLKRQRARITPTLFVAEVVAPLLTRLGEAWAQGEIKIYQEHLCSNMLTNLLVSDLLTMRPRQNFPRILLTTPPDELHALGLLMAQVTLADNGADCISLGPNTPAREIVLTAQALKCDIVGISISLAYPQHLVVPFLMELNALLPAWIEIWVGGAGVQKASTSPISRIRVFNDLLEPVAALHASVR